MNRIKDTAATYGENIHTYKIAQSTANHNAKIIETLQRAALRRTEQISLNVEASLDAIPTPSANLQAVPLIDLVTTFHARDDLARNSQVTYRSALRRYLAAHSNDPQFAQAYQCLQDGHHPVDSCDLKVYSMPQRKPPRRRSFPQLDYGKLHDELLDAQVVQKSRWAGRANIWIDAGLVTGLRPKEWRGVTWADAAMTTLRVINGKVKQDIPGYLRNVQISEAQRQEFQNAQPTTRDIPVPSNYRHVVLTHLAMIAQAEQQGIDFATYHKQVSQVIRRACQKIWCGKKQYTLYSLRRQFSANASDQYGVEISSKMMGHSKPQNPAASAYGLASQAYGRVGKGSTHPLKQTDTTQSVQTAHKKAAAPCKYLAYRDAKQAQEQASQMETPDNDDDFASYSMREACR